MYYKTLDIGPRRDSRKTLDTRGRRDSLILMSARPFITDLFLFYWFGRARRFLFSRAVDRALYGCSHYSYCRRIWNRDQGFFLKNEETITEFSQ